MTHLQARETLVFELGDLNEDGERLRREAGTAISELELKFRSLLLKLNSSLPVVDKETSCDDDDASFAFRVHTSVLGARTVTERSDEWAAVAVNAEEDAGEKTMVPVYSMSYPVQMNIFVVK